MKCFYHKSDFDGVCSAAIVKYLHPECELVGVDYDSPFPNIKIGTDEDIFMVDYSCDMDWMEKAQRTFRRFMWIDHHSSAIKASKDSKLKIAGKQEVGKGACELTWEFLFPGEEMPYGVRLLGRYDVWDLGGDGYILPFQYGFRTIKGIMNPEHSRWTLMFQNNLKIEAYARKGYTILKFLEQNNKEYMKRYSWEGWWHWHRAIFVNIGGGSSKVFDSLYDPEKHDIMVKFVYNKQGNWTVSLYTTKDIDCGKIARYFGGGGHKQAAGFTTDSLEVALGEKLS